MTINKSISPMRSGFMLVVMTILLSLLPFQGNTTSSSAEIRIAQTEVVVKRQHNRKKNIVFASAFIQHLCGSAPAIVHPLDQFHSYRSEIFFRGSQKHAIPIRRHFMIHTVFISETEDHILA